MFTTNPTTLDVEQAVRARAESLCCPIRYAPALLEAVPTAVFERDYGCGDPSAHLREDRFLGAFEEAGFYGIYCREPYRAHVELVPPRVLSVRREINWPSCADPSPLAALLVAHIPRVCSLLAPCERGASTQEGDQFISRRTLTPAEEVRPFPCDAVGLLRAPRDAKGDDYDVTTEGVVACATDAGGNGSCC